MINAEAVDHMLKTLDQCQKVIYTLEYNISIIEYVQTIENLLHADKVIEMLECFLEKEKAAAQFINDLLAIEYENLELNSILKRLHA